ncbi:hypothetical protein NDU88_002120 [Pleurodeles waltl]|uniref:DDE Tnp4 domain-containing protein n=1 Tax=Pleurodeles waltl TaxID=8319 RepID=A0AAV7U9K4_PLEWA|nr:hypothetical protein NDU88_002120 [Pleurodeles waltl]
MVVGVVTAREGCVVIGVLVMEVVDDDVVHAGVSGDTTGREVDDEEEGDTVETVDFGMSQPMFSNVLTRVLSAQLKHMCRYIVFPQEDDLATVKADFYALGHILNTIGAIDGTHVAFAPPPKK